MNIELVQVKNGIVFTTSQNICDETEKDHRNVLQDIDKLIVNLTAEKTAVKKYFVESFFVNNRNRKFRCFDITRDGFVLLAMGYNKPKFFRFKLDYINAFNSMEKRLKKLSLIRDVGIETRKTLTDELKDSGENERMHWHGFSTYTKLAYKLAGIEFVKGKDFRSTLSHEDLYRVENIESMMRSLIKVGKAYSEIKEDLNNLFIKKVG